MFDLLFMMYWKNEFLHSNAELERNFYKLY